VLPNVEQLPGVVADRRGRQSDVDVEPSVAAIGDPTDLTNDIGEDRQIAHSRGWHFHALLDRNVAGARLDRMGLAADAIGGDYSGGHGRNILALSFFALPSSLIDRSPSSR
jgi:hypothetical protein